MILLLTLQNGSIRPFIAFRIIFSVFIHLLFFSNFESNSISFRLILEWTLRSKFLLFQFFLIFSTRLHIYTFLMEWLIQLFILYSLRFSIESNFFRISFELVYNTFLTLVLTFQNITHSYLIAVRFEFSSHFFCLFESERSFYFPLSNYSRFSIFLNSK